MLPQRRPPLGAPATAASTTARLQRCRHHNTLPPTATDDSFAGPTVAVAAPPAAGRAATAAGAAAATAAAARPPPRSLRASLSPPSLRQRGRGARPRRPPWCCASQRCHRRRPCASPPVAGAHRRHSPPLPCVHGGRCSSVHRRLPPMPLRGVISRRVSRGRLRRQDRSANPRRGRRKVRGVRSKKSASRAPSHPLSAADTPDDPAARLKALSRYHMLMPARLDVAVAHRQPAWHGVQCHRRPRPARGDQEQPSRRHAAAAPLAAAERARRFVLLRPDHLGAGG